MTKEKNIDERHLKENDSTENSDNINNDNINIDDFAKEAEKEEKSGISNDAESASKTEADETAFEYRTDDASVTGAAGMKKGKDQALDDSSQEQDSTAASMRSRKKINIFLSIVLSIVLWAVVITDENPSITTMCTNIKIDYVNIDELEDNGLVLSDDSDQVIDKITIKGNRNDIIKLNKKNITAEVDASSFDEGKNYAYANIKLPSGITMESSSALRIRADVEKIIEKDIEIKSKFYGDIDDGKEAVQISSDPETISVKGAKSIVDSVKYVKAVVNSARVGDEPTDIRAKLTPVDSNGEDVEDVQLSVKTAVITAQVYVKKNVPLKVVTTGEPDLSVKLASAEAKNISIICESGIVDDITQIETEPLDISGMKEYDRLEVTPSLPKGVMLASSQGIITAELTFEKREEKTLTINTSDIKFSNLKSDEAVVFNDSTVDVKLYSDSAIPDEAADSIRLTIDCSQLSEDQKEVQLAVSWKSGSFMGNSIDADEVKTKASLIYLQ